MIIALNVPLADVLGLSTVARNAVLVVLTLANTNILYLVVCVMATHLAPTVQ